MTGKPLYLHGHQPLAVELDGPALRVTQEASADRRFPLERVSRVVASGQVAWTTEALLACADHGVPVSFLRRDGPVRARLLDARLAALLATAVARLLDRAGVAWDDPLTAVHGVDLVRGLAEVVAWDLQVPKLRHLWHRHRVAERNGEGYPVVTVRAVTHFYESQAPLVETAVGQLALRLYRFLLESLDGDAG